MKKMWTSELQRKAEYRMINAFLICLTGLALYYGLSKSNGVLPIISKISSIIFLSGYSYLIICIFLWIYSRKKVDPEKDGDKLSKELGIKKLSFCKLSDGSYEMHHKKYSKHEMEEMIRKGMSSEEIIKFWKIDLVSDFKRLESFIKAKELKGESVIIHTYTHIKMYKTWNKIARDAGLELEVMKGNNQKPVGFKWLIWKRDVYLTSGKVAPKGSIPTEWNKYVVTSKAI
ncbi:hypothetical protein MKY22_17170 [Exiguobacterium sp. FSL W8-0210]|uniref:hypothetical protein n=1 Tax=Exiguobacterium sp. FSL W8-0210 TaxID=2921598 RepID=UPI0030FBBFE5